ncbi:hypothetical protein ZIOFF_012554 [Zingiber officinale]|uniref:Uncharacterized protein n=1 Tax=Zingiber officinale TaxID=94328 RepID=A0A8J5M0H8_ZINOF|nr:hypothetical protein ZIOFF_012554 [Zingiber officinale]
MSYWTLSLIVKRKEYICKEFFYIVFEDEIHNVIIDNNLFRPGEGVAVAASGGKDSTVLAYVMSQLNRRHNYGLDLILLSVDEGITGYSDDSLETVKRNEIEKEGMEEKQMHWKNEALPLVAIATAKISTSHPMLEPPEGDKHSSLRFPETLKKPSSWKTQCLLFKEQSQWLKPEVASISCTSNEFGIGRTIGNNDLKKQWKHGNSVPKITDSNFQSKQCGSLLKSIETQDLVHAVASAFHLFLKVKKKRCPTKVNEVDRNDGGRRMIAILRNAGGIEMIPQGRKTPYPHCGLQYGLPTLVEEEGILNGDVCE